MTSNNIKEQIAWLLHQKPFIPPIVEYQPPLEDIPTSSTTLSLGEPTADTELSQDNGAAATSLPAYITHASQSKTTFAQPAVATQGAPQPLRLAEDQKTDMARLRTVPGSAVKPRLLTQTPPLQTRTSLAATSQTVEWKQGGPSPARQADQPRSRIYNQHPTPGTAEPLGETSDAKLADWDVDAIDLTGDSDGRSFSSPVAQPPSVAGRKRKSSEFEADISRRSRQSPDRVPSASPSDTEFAAIDEIVEDPPPPYSTVADDFLAKDTIQPTYEQQAKNIDEDHGEHAIEEEEYSVTETRIRTETRKRKSLSRMPSDTVFRTSGVTTQQVQQSQQGRDPRDQSVSVEARPLSTKKRRTVADSEDEDEPATIETETDPFVDKASTAAPEQQVESKVIHSSAEETETGQHRRPSEHRNNEQKILVSSIGPLPWKSNPSPFHRDSPTKPPTKVASLAADTQQSSTTEVTLEEKAALQAFMDWSDDVIQQHCEDVRKQLRSRSEAAYNFLTELGEQPPELAEELRVYKQKKQAMEDLLKLRANHNRVLRRKEELKQRVIEALEEGLDPSAYQADMDANKVIVQELRQLEADTIRLLRTAGFLQASGVLIGSHRLCTDSPNVVVRSTQVTPTSEVPGARAVPGSSGISHTEFVRQTQVAFERPMTPSKRKKDVSVSKQAYTDNRNMDRNSMRNTMQASGTDADAHFSPPKRSSKRVDFRSPERDYTYQTYNSQARGQGRLEFQHVQRSTHANASSMSAADMHGIPDDDEEFDDDEALFSTVMGTPPARVDEDDEGYGHYDGDEDMLEAEEELENQGTVRSVDWHRGSRDVFAETSGNQGIPLSTRKEVSETKKPAKSTTSMGAPALMQYPWSRDVKAVLKDRFHLRGFRQNQLEAINATLGGKDVFVLMPTGGGKSLCYQLPSLIRSGKTRGVTIVISPLLSLMEDQVQHLRDLQIQAFLINSECTSEQRSQIMTALRDPNVENFIQLLYVTPEMLNKSQAIIRAFESLHQRDKLARIVIDEAHCVSQWGHDFRPDYKLLGEVRQRFIGIPVMALTATATENVKVDVIHNLNIRGCEVFAQSFNRPNLTYEVRPKGKAKEVLDSIANTINTSYRNQSGIVYCLSRAKCEDVAEKLRKEYGIKARHYHAGMDNSERIAVQRQWQAGKYHVIVATIAFGMGIDKADVRFVIHHSIPKSLEGYYQETGRAGRDGKRSGCYLYYGYQDTGTLKRFIDDSDGSWEQKERQHQMLRNVVQFCENKSDCRRVQILAYFSEQFSREDCNSSCDNCNTTSTFESRDFTDYAASAINLVKHLQNENVTLLHCVDVFRGGKSKKIMNAGHHMLDEYGTGSDLDRGEVERLFHRLLSEDALTEHNKVNKAGFASQYIHLGKNCNEFKHGRRKLKIQVRVSPKGKEPRTKTASKATTKRTGVAAAQREYPLSTNVSSPVQAVSRRRVARPTAQDEESELHPNGYYRDSFVVPDNDFDDDDYEDEEFEPVRVAGRASRKTAKTELGPPITVDEKMNSLNPTHRMVVEDFMTHATQECQRILLSKSLRAVPFTDTMLREMAINFPRDERELLQIPNINPEMVQLYGKRFLKLIRNAQAFYESVVQADEDRPHDPNHENVIDLVSDEDEDEYGDFDMDDDEESEQEERSTYFPSADVAAFNAKFSASQAASKAMPPPLPKASSSSRAGFGGSRGRSSGGSRGGYRKASGGYSKGRGSAGVAKKTTSTTRKRGSGKGAGFPSNSFGGPSYGSGRGGSGGGGIGMMPV